MFVKNTYLTIKNELYYEKTNRINFYDNLYFLPVGFCTNQETVYTTISSFLQC